MAGQVRVKKKPATPKKAARSGRSPRAKKAENHAVALGVGARLKVVREQAGLTQRELARRAGVTNVTVSLIEQESHAPSLASLHRILTAIPITMAEFFALPVTKQDVLFYEHDDLAVVTRGSADLRVLGAERRDKKLQLFFERYAPGANTGDEPIVHDGETAAVVVQGSVELEVGGQRRRIHAGGGFQLIGKQPYRLTNTGRQTAIVVCACTPSLV